MHLDEKLDFFDCNCGLGPSAASAEKVFESGAELVEEMDYYGIEEALVYSLAAKERDAELGNRALLAAIEGVPRLHASWVLACVPDNGPSADDQVDEMLSRGVKAARIFPNRYNTPLSTLHVDDLFSKLERHRIPLFADFSNRHWRDKLTDWDWVARVCTDYPRLPLVLVRQAFGESATVHMMMARRGNLHLEVSYYQPCGGIDFLCSQGLSRQIVFGSGMPEYDAGLPISMLTYLQTDQEARRAMAGGTLRRLLQEAE